MEFIMFTSNFNSARVAKFGSGSTILRAARDTFLEEGQIASACPSIFASEAHGSRSEKYTYIPTIDVLRGLQREGFQPVEVRQGGSRDEEKRGFTKHLIRMRHTGSVGLVGGDSVRELVLLNAHDGTSSYQLMSGLFRMICTNGLITCEGGEMQRIAHKGDIINNVIEGAFTITENGKDIGERVDYMRGVTLEQGEGEAFAKAALALRYTAKDAETGEVKAAPVEPSQILRVRREADAGSDLWRTFNRVQEHLVQGGQGYTHRAANGRRSRRETRPVNSIDGNVNLNKALWVLAQEMGKLKAA